MKRKIDNSPAGRRYQRDAAVARGEMIEAKAGETMRLSRGKATVIRKDMGRSTLAKTLKKFLG